MLVAGLNTYYNLFAFPNNSEDEVVKKYVNPPRNIFLNTNSSKPDVLSISFYFDHSVIVFKNGQIAGIGNNKEGKLGPFFDRLIYNNLSYSNGFIDTFFISAVCGAWYTLYMHTNENKESPRATICFSDDFGNNDFLYADVSTLLSDPKMVPVAIFGGNEKSAIIDEKGNVILISKEIDIDLSSSYSNFNSSTSSLLSTPFSKIKCEYLYFPRSFFSEKAVSVACCDNFTIVLTKSGKLYGNGKINQENNRHVTESDKAKGITDRNCLLEIEEMRGQNVVQISGTFQHSLAVTLDGRVFCVGSNFNGQLGVGPEIKNTWEFIEITEISGKYRIINTSSGSGHSIMISDKGEVLTCGNNGYGQLFDDNSSATTSRRYYAEVVNNKLLKGRATFSIAGNCSSGLFINCEIPPNQPNFPIKPNKPYSIPEKVYNDMYKHARNEMARLHVQIDTLTIYADRYKAIKNKNDSDEAFYNEIIHDQNVEIGRLNEEMAELSNCIAQLQSENESLADQIEEYEASHRLNWIIDNDNFFIRDEQVINDYLNELGVSLSDGCKVRFVDVGAIESLVKLNENGDVRICEKIDRYSLFFFKKNSKSPVGVGEQLRRFFLEYEKLSSLDHPNIARTVGFCRGDSTTAASIVQEHEGIEMNKYSSELSEEEMKIIFEELISSLKYLLSRNIIHENLNPTTILINNNNNNSNSNNNKHIKLQILPQIELQRNEEQFNKEEKGKEEKNEEVESEVKSEVENKSESEVEVEVEVEVEEWSEFKAPEVKNKNKNKNNKRNKSGIVSRIVSVSGSVEIDEKSEVYSIGILLIYLLSGLRISESKIYELQSGIEEEEEEMEDGGKTNNNILSTDSNNFKRKINSRLKEIIKRMINENKNERPTIIEVEQEIIQSDLHFFG